MPGAQTLPTPASPLARLRGGAKSSFSALIGWKRRMQGSGRHEPATCLRSGELLQKSGVTAEPKSLAGRYRCA
jgi:hypothetical protein